MVSSETGPAAGGQNLSFNPDVHTRFSLRNVGTKPIAGLSFRILSSGGGSEGQAALILPSLQAAPGAVFPVRVDLQLPHRYSVRTQSPGVRILLDAVLWNDLSFYGPDLLHSRRRLLSFEFEARRENEYLRNLVGAGRLSEVREELNFGLPEDQPQLTMELTPLQVPMDRGKAITINTVSFGQAPLQLVGGGALLTDTALIGPHVLLRNSSDRRIRSVEVGFILRDERGHESRVSTLPAELALEPGQTRVLQQRANLLLSRTKGQPIVIRSLAAFVADVEFEDGSMWIPSRPDIERATDSVVLRRVLSECPETERMAGVFRRAGIKGVETALEAAN